jgi:Fanconi anemia group M protein
MLEGRQSTLDSFSPRASGTGDQPGPLFQEDGAGFLKHPLLHPGRIKVYPFQVTMAQAALTRNTLVVLPTGLGKTVVAALVAAETLVRNRGKVLFLAPTRPLVVQHSKSFAAWFTMLPRAVFTGALSSPRREGSWETARAVFATPEVIVHDLLEGRYSLKDVALIIFDEAHHARGKYAYTKIAAAYRIQGPPGARVLALTASPGNPGDIVGRLGLEAVDSRLREDPDVAGFVQDVSSSTVKVHLGEDILQICEMLRAGAREEMVKLQRYGLLRKKKLAVTSVKDLVDARKELFARPGSMGLRFQALARIGLAQHFLHSVELIEREGMSPFLNYIENLQVKGDQKKLDRTFLEHPVLLASLEKARALVTAEGASSHPKLEELLRLVSDETGRNPGAKILVFAEYRDAVRSIVKALHDRGIEARAFVGQAHRSIADPGMAQKKQLSILDAFKAGRFPVLVASRIAEEGLDIPQVDLVVEYDVLSSEMRTIQRRGRTGRTMAGKVVALISEGTKEEHYRVRELKGAARARRVLRKLSTL